MSHKERKRERERERESESANSRTRYYLNIHDIPFSVERKTHTYLHRFIQKYRKSHWATKKLIALKSRHRITYNFVTLGFIIWPYPASFYFYFLFFIQTAFRIKAAGSSGIQTLIVEVEGKHSDHLITAHGYRVSMPL